MEWWVITMSSLTNHCFWKYNLNLSFVLCFYFLAFVLMERGLLIKHVRDIFKQDIGTEQCLSSTCELNWLRLFYFCCAKFPDEEIYMQREICFHNLMSCDILTSIVYSLVLLFVLWHNLGTTLLYGDIRGKSSFIVTKCKRYTYLGWKLICPVDLATITNCTFSMHNHCTVNLAFWF